MALTVDEFVWEYQMKSYSLNGREIYEWIPFSTETSSTLEKAHQEKRKEIVVDGCYHIDLIHYIQQEMNHPDRQVSIRRRRCCLPPANSNNEDKSNRRERFTYPLELVSISSITDDTIYHGSLFLHKWLLKFTQGRMKVLFDNIYPAFIGGLIKEGSKDDQSQAYQIESDLVKLEEELHRNSSKNRMKILQKYSAILYTNHSYVHRVVNKALREDDQTKLDTIGPFCYLLFNYIGERFTHTSSILDRFRQFIHPNEIQTVTLYRGDRDFGNIAEEYRQAAGDKSKYFKWLPFVSTTRDIEVAQKFTVDILYIIQLRYYSSNEDQAKDLSNISHYPDEKEMLLLPGVQFQVDKVEYDNEQGRHLIYIKINSSYINKLK